jgi:hypothetical protein
LNHCKDRFKRTLINSKPCSRSRRPKRAEKKLKLRKKLKARSHLQRAKRARKTELHPSKVPDPRWRSQRKRDLTWTNKQHLSNLNKAKDRFSKREFSRTRTRSDKNEL